jgi:hypothetical protein
MSRQHAGLRGSAWKGSIHMTVKSQHIYRSANGDRWSLITDPSTDEKIVRHQANQSSGGQITDLEVAEFLDIGGSGPEFAALRDLLKE